MTPPQTTEREARGERLSAIGTHEVIPAALAEYCECVRMSRLGIVQGSPVEFEKVIMESCQSSKPVNNLHLNGGGLDGLIDDAFKLTYRECDGNMVKVVEKLKIGKGTAYDYRKRLNLV